MATRTNRPIIQNDVTDIINENTNTIGEKQDTKEIIEDINKSVDEISGEKNKTIKNNVITKRNFDAQEKIQCKSLFLGKLTYKSPTNGALYVWSDYGKVTPVPFGELETMNNFKPNYLQKPFILINDVDVVSYFNLNDKYEQVSNITKLEELFNTGDLEHIRKKIKEAIDVNQRDTVISQIRKMRKENKLVNINIINLLEEELKFDIG